jgi:hypothetical protein
MDCCVHTFLYVFCDNMIQQFSIFCWWSDFNCVNFPIDYKSRKLIRMRNDCKSRKLIRMRKDTVRSPVWCINNDAGSTLSASCVIRNRRVAQIFLIVDLLRFVYSVYKKGVMWWCTIYSVFSWRSLESDGYGLYNESKTVCGNTYFRNFTNWPNLLCCPAVYHFRRPASASTLLLRLSLQRCTLSLPHQPSPLISCWGLKLFSRILRCWGLKLVISSLSYWLYPVPEQIWHQSVYHFQLLVPSFTLLLHLSKFMTQCSCRLRT